MSDKYRAGDNYIIDDRTGRKIRASEARKEWTGSVVHKGDWEARHPQEFVRGLSDKQTVPVSRPRGPLTFIGPLTTEVAAAAAAGSQTLTVLSTVRFEAGDHLNIMLDNRDMHRAIVQSVDDSETLTLTANLPYSTSIGMTVVNVTAMAAASN